MSDTPRRCCGCGRAEDHTLNERKKRTVELRPYGPGGADICVECAFATPAAKKATARAFGAILEATEAVSDGPVMLGGDTNGPVPFDPRRIDGSGVSS
jgi:hypothetical protein